MEPLECLRRSIGNTDIEMVPDNPPPEQGSLAKQKPSAGRKPPIEHDRTQHLCTRCREDQLPSRLIDPTKFAGDDLSHGWETITSATVHEDSLEKTCYLCKQLAFFLSQNPSDDEFLLQLEVITRYGGAGSSVQPFIFYPKSERKLYLFSTGLWGYLPPGGQNRGTPTPYSSLPIATTQSHEATNRICDSMSFNRCQAQGWLADCRKNHKGCGGGQQRSNKFRPMKMIDWESRQLCLSEGPYVCLSYVWGASSEQNQTSDGLSRDLPATISDAINVTLAIGLKYLWVDRYCIGQDDKDEKHNMIQNMDAIYNGAELTIVAASGSNPNHGLPGVSRLRPGLPVLSVENQTLVAIEEPKAEIELSCWNTRAWTYQEALLCRRRLVFTNTQTYFQCQVGHHIDGLDHVAISPAVLRRFQVFPSRGIGNGIDEVYERLKEYYRKDVTFPADTINAFTGIFQAFRQVIYSTSIPLNNHFYGIPVFCEHQVETPVSKVSTLLNLSLALGLAWRIYGSHSVDHPMPMSNTSVLFPSWSWAAVKACQPKGDPGELEFTWGPDKFDFHLDEALNIRVHHHTGIAMDLLQYVHHEDGYTAFEPRIDITSMVGRGTLWKDDNGVLKIRECPTRYHGDLHLQENFENIAGEVLIIFIGAEIYASKYAQFVFVLAQQLSNGHHRRVGVLSPKILYTEAFVDLHTGTSPEVFHRIFKNTNIEWRRQTITLV